MLCYELKRIEERGKSQLRETLECLQSDKKADNTTPSNKNFRDKDFYKKAFGDVQRFIYEKVGTDFSEDVLKAVGTFAADYWLYVKSKKISEQKKSVPIPKPRKGVFLQGDRVEQGNDLVKQLFGRSKDFECYETQEILEKYRDSGPVETMNNDLAKKEVILLNLGSEEEKGVKYYGYYWQFSNFLSWRYDCWNKYRSLTVITTDLTGNQIRERYGDVMIYRIRKMCDIVPNSYD